MAWQAQRVCRAWRAVKWLVRFLGWSTLLVGPCLWAAPVYQGLLVRIASALFTPFGLSIEVVDIEVMAPIDLGLFTAMCLASLRASPGRRRRALMIGLPSLVVLEILTIAGAMAIVLLVGARDLSSSLRMMRYTIETIPWIAAPLAWLVWLGPFELPPRLRRQFDSRAA